MMYLKIVVVFIDSYNSNNDNTTIINYNNSLYNSNSFFWPRKLFSNYQDRYKIKLPTTVIKYSNQSTHRDYKMLHNINVL